MVFTPHRQCSLVHMKYLYSFEVRRNLLLLLSRQIGGTILAITHLDDALLSHVSNNLTVAQPGGSIGGFYPLLCLPSSFLPVTPMQDHNGDQSVEIAASNRTNLPPNSQQHQTRCRKKGKREACPKTFYLLYFQRYESSDWHANQPVAEEIDA